MNSVAVPRNKTEATSLTQSRFVKILMKTSTEEAASGLSQFIINFPQRSDHGNNGSTDPRRPVGCFDPDVIPRKPGAFEKPDFALDLHNSELKLGDFPGISDGDVALARSASVVSDFFHIDIYPDDRPNLGVRISQQPFIAVFMTWFAAASLGDLLVVRAAQDQDAIEIQFPHTGGALEGFVDRNGLSVSAVLNGEGWDFLFSEDLVGEFRDGMWSCSLCSPSSRMAFDSVEALWGDHLFQPLRDWVETELRPAAGVMFHGGDGITWATLARKHEDDGHFHRFE